MKNLILFLLLTTLFAFGCTRASEQKLTSESLSPSTDNIEPIDNSVESSDENASAATTELHPEVDAIVSGRSPMSVDEEEVGDEPTITQHIAKDDKWGQIIIDVVENEHPVDAGTELTISVLCKKQKKTAAVPTKEKLVERKACSYVDYKLDAKKKIVTVNYTLAGKNVSPSDDPCTESWSQPFNLKELCESWKK